MMQRDSSRWDPLCTVISAPLRGLKLGLPRSVLVLAFACLAFCLPPAVALAEGSGGDAHSARAHVAESAPGGSAEKLLILYNEFMRGGGNGLSGASVSELSVEDYAKLKAFVQSIYTEAARDGGSAHKKVALLISHALDESATSQAFNAGGYEHRQISDAMSVLMAQARDRMIEEAIVDVLEKHRAEGWEVARSDSGNPKSGMRSDLDQTFYVFKRDPESGALVRDESLDSVFIDQLKQTWDGKFGDLRLDMLDVVSIEGRGRFPDPRAFSVHEFGPAYLGTIAELRNIEGAYTTYGAVLQQVQKRQLQALQNPDSVRVWQQYGRLDDTPEGELGKLTNPDLDLAMRSVFYATPELLPDSAFGAAVANYFELQHYMNAAKFNTKYHLRTFDDSLFSRFLMDNFQRMKDKVDYLDMNSNQRNAFGEEMLKRLFPGDAPEVAAKRRAHLLALEVSRDMRLEHVAEKPEDLMKVEAYRKNGSVPTDDLQKKALMFDSLTRELFGDKYKPQETGELAQQRLKSQVEAAEAYHRKLASEFCLESIHNTGADNFKLLMNPDLADRCRYLLDVEPGKWPEVKANLVESSKMTMLFAIYDLGMVDGARMLQRLDIELPGNRWQLFKLYAEAQFMPIRAAIANPDAYMRAYKPKLDALAGQVKFYFLDQLGYERVGEAEVAHAALAEQKLVWNWRKVARSMFWDVGTVSSLGQVAEVYFVSKGDMQMVAEKILDEMFLSIPILGQAENVRRGGVESAVLVGAAIYFPPVAKIMVAYTIGQSMYTIYQVEAGIPTQGNIEDAVYRGFAGPETVAYGEIGKAPPIFNDSDYARLEQLEKELAQARGAIPSPPMYNRDPALRAIAYAEYRKKRDEAQKRYDEVEARLKPQIDQLRARKIEFEQYRDGTWAGGYFTEAGAVKQQQWMSASLLDPVPPIYAFMTDGVVDFRVDYEPAKGEARLAELERIISISDSIEEQVNASAERTELNLLRDRYERAQRYLERSKTRRELAYRIKRDSLFRWCQENRIEIDKYVDDFLARNGKTLFDELEEIGLVTRYERGLTRYDGYSDPVAEAAVEAAMNRISPSTAANLKQRMLEDWERSRDLIATYLQNEKGREEKNRENVEKAKDLFMNEAFGLAAAKLKDDKAFMDYITAMRFSAVKRMKPTVRGTLFKIARNGEDFRKGKAGEPISEQFELDAAVDIFADDTLYLRPYKVKTSVLKASDRASPNVGLMEDARAEIEAIRAEHAEEIEKGAGLIGIVSVYASGIANVEGALPQTLDGLPGFEGGRPATGEVLIGQQVGFVPVKSITVKVDPIRIRVLDQAGNPIVGQKDMVTVDGNDVYVADAEYWTTREFRTYGEKLEIAVRYKLPDGRELTASAQYGVDDVENWLDPQLPAEPITLRLPVFVAGSFRLKGVVSAQKPDAESPYPGYATIRNEPFGIDKGTYIPGGELRTSVLGDAVAAAFGRDAADTPRDGSFDVSVNAPVMAGDQATLSFEGSTSKHFFSAVQSASLPATPGVVDVGQVVLKVDNSPVRVPAWNEQNPPDFKAYAGQLSGVHLRGRPKLGKPSPEERLQYKLSKTEPGAGSLVPKGSEVSVVLHDKYARKVPNVVGLKVDQAKEFLGDQGFTAQDSQGENAPSRQKESTVISQSVAPGEEHRPDEPIRLVVYAPYVPSCVVPKLAGMTEQDAREAVEKAKLTIEVVDRAMATAKREERGLTYKQEPIPGTRAEEGEKVKVWLYAGGEQQEPAPSGPFYAVFQIYTPDFDKSNVPKFRKKAEGESDESYRAAALQYADTLPIDRIVFSPVDAGKSVLPMHVSREALQRYPRGEFQPGAKFACKFSVSGKNREGSVLQFSGTLLLGVFGTYEDMNQMLAAHPVLETQKNLQALAFTRADGTADLKDERSQGRLGPLTKDWTAADRKETVRFFVQIASMITCYVATVAYEGPMADEVVLLREFRDRVMTQTPAGRRLIELYYEYGPGLALSAMEHPTLRMGLKVGIDGAVAVLQRTDWNDPLARMALECAMSRLAAALSALLPEKESAFDEFREAYIRQEKMPSGIGIGSFEP
ncbi:MAG: PASTA domain-containing protein [Phycisphaerales bacterium]